MIRVRLGSLLVAAMLCAGARPVFAQRPTPDEARALLQTRPDIVAELRQRLANSGLTPDQVRARLRAEGYPENLLDAYLGNDTSRAPMPTDDVLDAVAALGIVDSLDLGAGARAGGRRRPPVSIEPVDSVPSLSRDPRRVSRRPGDRLDTLALGSRAGRRFTNPDSGYQIFGMDVFRNATTQFEANLSGPVDANYRLGPGDRLVLILTGDVELAHSLDVTREGFVIVPQVGQLYVANLTLADLENLLYARLARVYSGVRRGPGATTRFSVSVARLRSNQVYVVGDVFAPGSYRISSAGTALTALYASGGPTDAGSLRRIEVRRGGTVASQLDVYDYLLRGDASRDVRLSTGDVVFVPPYQRRVRVVGEVIRPATYELKEGETLSDVLRAAGGFTEQAARRRVQIERILPPAQRAGPGYDRIVIDVASDALTTEFGPPVPIEGGDVIRVFEVSERVRNRISVLGNVWTPGAQGLTEGMTLGAAIRAAGGVKPDTYLGHVLITRLLPDSTRVQLRASLRDTSGVPTTDIALREDDEITIYSVTEFRPERYVAIAGAVRKSGRFPYREGMTLRDLVLLAGGLEESAYLREAEIARLPESRAGGVTAQTIRVPMDSSYLFERADGRRSYLGPPGLPAPARGAADVPLAPYDNVLIMRQPDWELQRTVIVVGEVRYPGTYALVSKGERLRDVLQRAGGLTTEGFAGGIVFYRKRNGTGRIGVDLPKILRTSGRRRDRDDLVLQDGDSIYIPRYSGVVNVQGAVNSPVAVAYVPGRNIWYYIAAAGGPSRKADRDRSYVTQPNGKVESVGRTFGIARGTPEPGPGSTVYVPERDPADRKDYTAITASVAQILASLVAILVVVTRN